MTHLLFRNGRAYFRYRLPPLLRAIPKPKHWPASLSELVSEKNPVQFKHELTKALGTRDEREGKRRAAVELARVEALVADAIRVLQAGPKRTISDADVTMMAQRFGHELIAGDLELRRKGFPRRGSQGTTPTPSGIAEAASTQAHRKQGTPAWATKRVNGE